MTLFATSKTDYNNKQPAPARDSSSAIILKSSNLLHLVVRQLQIRE